jgi:hypothetical protein
MDNCRICNAKIITICKCFRGDRECENGHWYHYSPYHKQFHLGQSDHSKSHEECCVDKKEC